MKKSIITVIAVAFSILGAIAQPPQGGPQGRPQGGPMGPQMSPEKYVEYMDKELSLTDVQKEQISKIFSDTQAEMKKMFESMEEGERPNPEDMMAISQKRDKAIMEILSDEQKTKYEEMSKRRPGRPGGQRGPQMDPQKMLDFMTKELSLSDEQKEQVSKIMSEERSMNEKSNLIKAVLNDEQKAKYDEFMKKSRGPEGPGGPGGPGGPEGPEPPTE